MPTKTISVRIDGELVSCPRGANDSRSGPRKRKANSDPLLSQGTERRGACRVCMVELAGTDRLLPACTTPIQEGMSIKTNSAKLALYRKMAVELLLVERNHICSACVSNGHCELQSLAQSLGITMCGILQQSSPAVDMSHPRFVIDHNRCIFARAV